MDSLEQDPFNPSLLSDAALLAFDLNNLPLCQELVDRLASVRPDFEALQQLQILLPIARQRFGRKSP
jgi:hypothetical protein